MSVVTHRSFHLSVTNSNRESTLGKMSASSVETILVDGTRAFDADFSTAGVGAVRARCIGLNWCWLMRYEAIDDLPAQMPEAVSSFRRGSESQLTSAQSYKHFVAWTKRLTEQKTATTQYGTTRKIFIRFERVQVELGGASRIRWLD